MSLSGLLVASVPMHWASGSVPASFVATTFQLLPHWFCTLCVYCYIPRSPLQQTLTGAAALELFLKQHSPVQLLVGSAPDCPALSASLLQLSYNLTLSFPDLLCPRLEALGDDIILGLAAAQGSKQQQVNKQPLIHNSLMSVAG